MAGNKGRGSRLNLPVGWSHEVPFGAVKLIDSAMLMVCKSDNFLYTVQLRLEFRWCHEDYAIELMIGGNSNLNDSSQIMFFL